MPRRSKTKRVAGTHGVQRIPAIERARLAVRFVRRLSDSRYGPPTCWLAVIAKGIEDLAHPVHCADAVEYFSSRRFHLHADWADLDADVVRAALRHAGLLQIPESPVSGREWSALEKMATNS